MSWEILLHEDVDRWFLDLCVSDLDTANLVMDAIDKLAEDGPTIGRPLVDRLKGSKYHNMKELRPGSSGSTEIRILFAFDPVRRALLLVAGDKSGDWSGWYRKNIPVAEQRYSEHLDEMKKEDR
ncbi:type II toxin-antitoxin system RelE/ParE family toxin [Longispora fulva]|uniref:Addiction module toxin RelE n=1 Tax=Longispora fulva TaxID=619741 RepID=A0A8J7GN10_9ACTN|nr:hypothetical protein [Longispora fulva]